MVCHFGAYVEKIFKKGRKVFVMPPFGTPYA